ncbi:MAG: site-specific integrase [Polyangia bacterium]
MRTKSRRVLGPYLDHGLYRLVVVEKKLRKSVSAHSEAEALLLKAELEKYLHDPTSIRIGAAFEQFLEHKRQQGLDASSVETLDFKLRPFLPLEESMGSLTPQRAQELYLAETQRITRYGRPCAVQTHHSILRLAKHFARWAIEQGHLTANPFEKVRPVGKANTGKPQLRIDEARRLFQTLMEWGERGHEGAIAVLCQLLLGLRTSEVLQRQVRDLDDTGRLLWIPRGKTKNARRRLEVPEPLRPLLLRLVKDRSPEELIFGRGRERPRVGTYLWNQVRTFCQRAGLPRVCPHSLRGLHSSLAIAAGSTPSVVAAALGHGSFAITERHYVDPDTLRNSAVQRVAGALIDASSLPKEPLERLRALTEEQLERLLLLLERSEDD